MGLRLYESSFHKGSSMEDQTSFELGVVALPIQLVSSARIQRWEMHNEPRRKAGENT
jgi:hypothetical protein